MTFNYDWLPKLELQRLDSPNGRKYETPEGNQYESVTTFLGKLKREEIDNWRLNVGEKAANRTSCMASNRGTAMHNNIEKFLMNEEVIIPKTNYVERSLFVPFSKLLEKTITNIRAIEYPLYSDYLKLAGTMDLCADYDSIPSVIDFKSSNKKKDKYEVENYFLQTTIYSMMIEERYRIKVPQLVILIGVEFGNSVQVFIENRNNYVKKVLELVSKNLL